MFRVFSAMAFAVVLSLLASTTVEGSPDKGKGKGGVNKPAAPAKIEGTITAVGPASVTITRRSGTSVTVNVAAATKIERNDRHVTLAAFKLGDRGEAVFNATTLVASKVEATGP